MIGNEGMQYCLQPACFLNCWKSPVMKVDAALWNATGRSWRRLSWVMLWPAMMWIHGRHINRWWRPGREKRRKKQKAERLGELGWKQKWIQQRFHQGDNFLVNLL